MIKQIRRKKAPLIEFPTKEVHVLNVHLEFKYDAARDRSSFDMLTSGPYSNDRGVIAEYLGLVSEVMKAAHRVDTRRKRKAARARKRRAAAKCSVDLEVAGSGVGAVQE